MKQASDLEQSIHDAALVVAASARAITDVRGIRGDLAALGFDAVTLGRMVEIQRKARLMRARLKDAAA